MAFKRFRSYRKRPVRRYAGRPYKRTYKARSRKLYSRSGRNMNAIVELKTLDQGVNFQISFAHPASHYLPAYALCAAAPTRIIDGADMTVLAAGCWNGTSVGVQENQREGRKINMNRFVAKYAIHYEDAANIGVSANKTDLGFGLFVNVAVVLDTAANNNSGPSLDTVFVSTAAVGDGTGVHRTFFMPNPSGVNRFKILKHRVHRLMFRQIGSAIAEATGTTNLATMIAQFEPILGSFNIDLKGLPVTYSTSSVATTVTAANLAQICDNALHIFVWGNSFTSGGQPNDFYIEIFGRTIFTG